MGQQTIRKAFLSFYVCIAFIIVIIGNIIAPRIALSGQFSCCILPEPEAASAMECRQMDTFYLWAVTKCSMIGYNLQTSTTLRRGQPCKVELCPEYPCGTVPVAEIQWWHEKDFTGESHKRSLWQSEYGKCQRLVHNDAMKSIKFSGKKGQKLEIFDDKECKTDDDWGVLHIPRWWWQ